jgi:Icc-related predicted phosphoesterase
MIQGPMSPLTRLAVIGDIHGRAGSLRKVLALAVQRSCQGLLLVGDFHPGPYAPPELARKSRLQILDEMFAALSEAAPGLPALWVPGNHDWPDIRRAGKVDRWSEELAGLRVTGIGGAGPDHFGFLYEWTEDDIRALSLPEADILLCHAPPSRTTLDKLLHGRHVGSDALRERALRHRGVLVCGHFHKAAGIERPGRCLCLNAGSLGEPYARLQWRLIEWQKDGVEVVHEDLESGQIQRQDLSWSA